MSVGHIEITAGIGSRDIAVLSLEDIGDQTPNGIAQAIIAAQNGKRAVEFRVKDRLEYWHRWAFSRLNSVDAELHRLGYAIKSQTNLTGNGKDYILTKFEIQTR